MRISSFCLSILHDQCELFHSAPSECQDKRRKTEGEKKNFHVTNVESIFDGLRHCHRGEKRAIFETRARVSEVRKHYN